MTEPNRYPYIPDEAFLYFPPRTPPRSIRARNQKREDPVDLRWRRTAGSGVTAETQRIPTVPDEELERAVALLAGQHSDKVPASKQLRL